MFLYSLYQPIIKPLLFLLDPEQAHDLIINSGKFITNSQLCKFFKQTVKDDPLEFMGLNFKNRLGLAAGLDKNGDAIELFGALGFSHIELGTVTPLAQAGNEKPRMFRVISSNSIINRMGFNNKGVDYLVENIKNTAYDGVIGVSIGKNESTPLEKAHCDYQTCMQKLYKYVGYITINVSCPNTKDLTSLQNYEYLNNLVGSLKENQQLLEKEHHKYVPLVVKISPDLTNEQIDDVIKVCQNYNIDALALTNTTVQRDMIYGQEHAGEWGGLSGEALAQLSLKTLQYVHSKTSIPLISIGGIGSVLEARNRLANGAGLLQIYSSLIYQGPRVVKNILDNL